MLKKDAFFRKFKVEKKFEDSNLEWSILEGIYDDYVSRRNEIAAYAKDLENYIRQNFKSSFHSIRCRIKDPEQLIEKSYGSVEKNRIRSTRGLQPPITGRLSET